MNYEKILNKLGCAAYYVDGTAVTGTPKMKHIKSFEKIISMFSKNGRTILELHYERGQSLAEIRKHTGIPEAEVERTLKDMDFYFHYRPTKLFIALGECDYYHWTDIMKAQLNGTGTGDIYGMPAVLLYDGAACLKGELESDDGAEMMTLSEVISRIYNETFNLPVIRLMTLHAERLNVMALLHHKALAIARNTLHGYTIPNKYDTTMFQVSKLAKVMGYRETHLAGLLLSQFFIEHLEQDHRLYIQMLKEEPFRTWIEEGVEFWQEFDNTLLLNMSCYTVPGMAEIVDFGGSEVPKTGLVSEYCNEAYKNDIRTRLQIAEALQLHGVIAPLFVHPYQFSAVFGLGPEERRKQAANGFMGIYK